MLLAAAIGVKDEVELIERCLVHLKNIGIDQFLVFDFASTDGTREILTKHQSGSFRVIDVPDDASMENRFEIANKAVKNLDADWIMALDADEFPLPRDGHLRTCSFLNHTDLVTIPRYNVAVGVAGPLIPESISTPHYSEIWLVAEKIDNFRELLAKDESMPWIRGRPAPKVMVRRDRFSEVLDGGHWIVPTPGPDLRVAVPDDLITAHVALTSYARFRKKICNVNNWFSAHRDHYGDEKHKAWHWKRWLALQQSGKLEEEFRKSVWDEEALGALRANGVLRCASDILGLQKRET